MLFGVDTICFEEVKEAVEAAAAAAAILQAVRLRWFESKVQIMKDNIAGRNINTTTE